MIYSYSLIILYLCLFSVSIGYYLKCDKSKVTHLYSRKNVRSFQEKITYRINEATRTDIRIHTKSAPVAMRDSDSFCIKYNGLKDDIRLFISTVTKRASNLQEREILSHPEMEDVIKLFNVK